MEETVAVHVLLADDHPLIMTGFAMALPVHGIEVAGIVRTPEEAIKKYDELQPDVVVLDIRFGTRLNGFDAARAILEKHEQANIVFLSQFDQDPLIKESYRIGARAFITKACDPEQLATAIKIASIGESYFLPEVAERLAKLAIKGDTSPQSLLTPREIEIFTLMAQGLTNLEIAEKMGLSPKTISNTSQTVKEKLGIHRAAEITRLAVKYGLLEP